MAKQNQLAETVWKQWGQKENSHSLRYLEWFHMILQDFAYASSTFLVEGSLHKRQHSLQRKLLDYQLEFGLGRETSHRQFLGQYILGDT